jgi:hypothetical protein
MIDEAFLHRLLIDMAPLVLLFSFAVGLVLFFF